MSLNSEIVRIKAAKQDIKSAIIEKGVAVETELIDEYGDLIRQIPAGSTPAIVNGDYFFYLGRRWGDRNVLFPNLIKGFNTMINTFTCDYNSSMRFGYDDLSNIDTSNVIKMTRCFKSSNSGGIINISNWNINNVDSVEEMFNDSFFNESSLVMPNYITSGTTKPCNMYRMFANHEYSIINSVDLGWIDTSYPDKNYYSEIFYNNTKIYDILNFTIDYGHNTGQQFPSQLVNLTFKPGHSIARDLDEDFTLDLSNCPNLNANQFLESVGTYSGTRSRTVKLNTASYNILTPEQIVAFTSKGYTLTI